MKKKQSTNDFKIDSLQIKNSDFGFLPDVVSTVPEVTDTWSVHGYTDASYECFQQKYWSLEIVSVFSLLTCMSVILPRVFNMPAKQIW